MLEEVNGVTTKETLEKELVQLFSSSKLTILFNTLLTQCYCYVNLLAFMLDNVLKSFRTSTAQRFAT